MNDLSKIKLLLVDDHPVVRNGLRQICDLDSQLKIVADVGTMAEAIQQARLLSPAVILMDVRLPDGDGIEASRQIKMFLPNARVLFLTSYADNRFVLSAMEAGADGYLLKESDSQRIVDAIRVILRGGTFFDPVLTKAAGETSANISNPLALLSVQEKRILSEVAKGRTDKEVASALGIATKTARNYLDRIFTKLQVHTRTEAALLHARFDRKSWE